MNDQSERARQRAEHMVQDDTELHPGQTIRILFTELPGPGSCLVELENEDRRSIEAGEWRQTDDGLWELAIRLPTR